MTALAQRRLLQFRDSTWKGRIVFLTALMVSLLVSQAADETRHPDVLKLPADLESPTITSGEPAPGKMVMQSLPAYAGTEVAHAVYLPTDWVAGKRFPVIIEYLGNGLRVRDNKNIGYALSGGRGFIWVGSRFSVHTPHPSK